MKSGLQKVVKKIITDKYIRKQIKVYSGKQLSITNDNYDRKKKTIIKLRKKRIVIIRSLII